MSVLRNTGLVDAPLSTVAAALRHTRTAEQGLSPLGVRGRAVTPAGVLLVPGDELAFRVTAVPGFPVALRTRVTEAEPETFSSVLVAGPLPRLRHETVLADVGGRTLVTDSVAWISPLGPAGHLLDVALLRRFVLKVLSRRIALVRRLAEHWAGAPVVVGAAIVRDGRLLAQQRHYPAADAGRWELPGGRVEAGETEEAAVARECKEELDVRVRPLHRVGTDVPLRNGMLLRLHAAELGGDVEPRAVEHRALRWVGPGELTGLDWLDADRVLVHSLRGLLRQG